MACLHKQTAAILNALDKLLRREACKLEFRFQLALGILQELQQGLLTNLLLAFLTSSRTRHRRAGPRSRPHRAVRSPRHSTCGQAHESPLDRVQCGCVAVLAYSASRLRVSSAAADSLRGSECLRCP